MISIVPKILLVSLFTLLPMVAQATPLQAGASRVSLVPDFPVGMGGFFDRKARTTEVHDPVYARALVCASSGTSVAVVATDLINMTWNVVDAARGKIEALTGIPRDNVLICAAHNHSGPSGYQENISMGSNYQPELFDFLVARIVQAVTEAHAGLRPAVLGYLTGELEGVTRNRHQENENVDPGVGVIKVWDPETREIIATLFNFTGHPVIVGSTNLKLSGEFPGMAERTVESVLGGVSLFTQGACGDVTVKREGDPFLEVQRFGRVIAGEVIKTAEQIQHAQPPEIASMFVPVTVPQRELPTVDEAKAQMESAKAAFAEAEKSGMPTARLKKLERVADSSETTLTLARHATANPAAYQAATKASVHVLQLGSVYLVGIPGELFVEYGLEIKDRIFQQTGMPGMLVGYANGYIGYIVTPRARHTGGYESAISRVSEEAGRVLVEQSLQAVDHLEQP